MKFYFLFLCLFFAKDIYAQEIVYFQELPVPTGIKKSVDSSIPNIRWNRYKTQNFSILSIDINQGKFLETNIELMKTWSITRWGLPDNLYSIECRIFCVPDKETMLKLFNMDASFAEVLGGINCIWLILDGKPAETIPSALTMVSLSELEKDGYKFGWWLYRGLPNINLSLSQIKSNLIFIKPFIENDEGMFFTKSIFLMTKEKWEKLPVEQKKLFDAESASLCLLIRKEFGEKLFLKFIITAYSESDLNECLGYDSYNQIDGAYKRFIINICEDIVTKTIPDSYLQINKVKR